MRITTQQLRQIIREELSKERAQLVSDVSKNLDTTYQEAKALLARLKGDGSIKEQEARKVATKLKLLSFAILATVGAGN